MKKKLISVLILITVLISLTTVFTACGPGAPKEMLGKWEWTNGAEGSDKQTYSLELNGDGSFESVNQKGVKLTGTFSVKGDRITMNIDKKKSRDEDETPDTLISNFILDGDKLCINALLGSFAFVGGNTDTLVGTWKSYTEAITDGKSKKAELTVDLKDGNTGSINMGGNPINITDWAYDESKNEVTGKANMGMGESTVRISVMKLGDGICGAIDLVNTGAVDVTKMILTKKK